jgi:hypothetical protein
MKKLLTTLRLVNIPYNPENGSEGELFYNSSASAVVVRSKNNWKEIPFNAIVDTDATFPAHKPGLLYFNRSDFNFYISYADNWLPIGSFTAPENVILNGGNAETSIFEAIFDGGNSSSAFESNISGGFA